jgi:23S rRNA U2552 (ribose-2'-O)-methylase RlmE/FtsJ
MAEACLQECPVPQLHCDDRVHTIVADARTLAPQQLMDLHAELCLGAAASRPPVGFHTVLSDMCHDTIGVAAADVARSLQLARCAAAIAVGSAMMLDQPTTSLTCMAFW